MNTQSLLLSWSLAGRMASSPQSRGKWAAVGLVVTFLGAAPLSGQLPPGPAQVIKKYNADTHKIEKWKADIIGLFEMLQTPGVAAATKVRDRALRLHDDLLAGVISGDGGCELFGYTYYLLAVAEARLGDLESAKWHWQVVQSLLPERRAEFARRFPDIREQLTLWLLPESRWDDLETALVLDPDSESKGTGEQDSGEGPVQAPVVLKQVLPQYPKAPLLAGREGRTVVVCIVDKNGFPKEPVMRRSCGVAGFDAAVMDALRSWRFKPATRGGSPVSANYTLEVKFSLRTERSQ